MHEQQPLAEASSRCISISMRDRVHECTAAVHADDILIALTFGADELLALHVLLHRLYALIDQLHCQCAVQHSPAEDGKG